MAKYSVRFYSEYVDEIIVEAPSAAEARTLAEEYEYVCDLPREGEMAQFAGKAERVTHHQYVDSTDTMVNELDEDGNYLDEE